MRRRFLQLMALLFLASAVFHASRLVAPLEGDPSGFERHAVFLAINLTAAYALVARPLPLLYAFPILVVQQLWSHGGAAWREWSEAGRVDVVSIAIVIALPLTALALWRDPQGGRGFDE